MNFAKQSSKIGVALFISVVLNGIFISVSLRNDPTVYPPSKAQSVVNMLTAPAGTIAEWLAPGHGGKQILALIITSVILYAMMTWCVLSLPGVWRQRH